MSFLLPGFFLLKIKNTRGQIKAPEEEGRGKSPVIPRYSYFKV